MVKALATSLCCFLAMGIPAFADGELQRASRQWTCIARSQSGGVFLGRSRIVNTARRIALDRCSNQSSRCFFAGCR